MSLGAPVDAVPWSVALGAHVRSRPAVALGLGLASLVVLGLLAVSIGELITGVATAGLKLAVLGGTAGFLATAIGAVPALALKTSPRSSPTCCSAARRA
jgi:ZIP family zinc transporter